ncbi:g9520 [Coccomyxa elongata]
MHPFKLKDTDRKGASLPARDSAPMGIPQHESASSVPCGQTGAATVMVAERAAQILLGAGRAARAGLKILLLVAF